MNYLKMLLDFSDYQDDPDRWDSLTDEDKRYFKKVGIATWLVCMGVILWDVATNTRFM